MVSVHESFGASHSSTITITPDQPTDVVTQVMIDEAHNWADQALQFLVTNAVMKNIKESSDDNVADFRIDVIQDIEETFEFDKTVEWSIVSQGALPSLTSLGYAHPFEAEGPFYKPLSAQKYFEISVEVDADFDTQISYVTVELQYDGVKVTGTPYLFNSKVPHTFKMPWSEQAGETCEVDYTVVYQDSSVTPYRASQTTHTGNKLVIHDFPLPRPIDVTFDASSISFNGLESIRVSNYALSLSDGKLDLGRIPPGGVVLNQHRPKVTIASTLNYLPSVTIARYRYDLTYHFTDGRSEPKLDQTGTEPVVSLTYDSTVTVEFHIINVAANLLESESLDLVIDGEQMHIDPETYIVPYTLSSSGTAPYHFQFLDHNLNIHSQQGVVSSSTPKVILDMNKIPVTV